MDVMNFDCPFCKVPLPLRPETQRGLTFESTCAGSGRRFELERSSIGWVGRQLRAPKEQPGR